MFQALNTIGGRSDDLDLLPRFRTEEKHLNVLLKC